MKSVFFISSQLLNRQIQDSNQISSAFEHSFRGAAYIYSQRPPYLSSKKEVIVTNPLTPLNNKSSQHHSQSTTANDAIKLALRKLSERNLSGNADYNRVSQLAQQLAKVSNFIGDILYPS